MKKIPRYSVKKIASELQKNDRFYMSGKKYCVTDGITQNYLGRWVVFSFMEVDGRIDTICNMVVPPSTEFMILTGESGIGEKAYNNLQMEKK